MGRSMNAGGSRECCQFLQIISSAHFQPKTHEARLVTAAGAVAKGLGSRSAQIQGIGFPVRYGQAEIHQEGFCTIQIR